MDTSALIAGAGIGGLAAALTLHARGLEVTVLERASELRALGVGINLLPHAVRELHTLGLGDELARIAVAPHSIGFYDDAGTLLFREPRGVDGGYGHPQLSVHRGELQMLLLNALRERAGRDVVRTGCFVTRFDDEQRGVTVDVDGRALTAGVLVGADGLHSAIRAQLHPGPDPLLWSGTRMFRGAADMASFLDGETMAIIKGGNGVDLVTYPIGSGLVNWVLMVPTSDAPNTPQPLPGDAAWNQPGRPADVLEHVHGWTVPWLDISELVSRTAEVFEYPMVDRDVLPSWGRGRVTLLGDAAHPMYPVGANGGSQAIVDAVALADHLANATEVTAGLRAYEHERRTATADIVAANREMHGGGASRRPADLANVAQKYRRDTHADESRGATT